MFCWKQHGKYWHHSYSQSFGGKCGKLPSLLSLPSFCMLLVLSVSSSFSTMCHVSPGIFMTFCLAAANHCSLCESIHSITSKIQIDFYVSALWLLIIECVNVFHITIRWICLLGRWKMTKSLPFYSFIYSSPLSQITHHAVDWRERFVSFTITFCWPVSRCVCGAWLFITLKVSQTLVEGFYPSNQRQILSTSTEIERF